ncbi:hypothetical protein GCM10027051_20080 [Niabella terrae]
MSRLIKSYWPAIIWSAIVLVLLALPGDAFQQEESFLSKIYFDKLVHLGLFALLVLTWCWGIYNRYPSGRLMKTFLWICICSILFGYLMELVQKYWVPNRDYDLWDVVADAAGALIGLIYSRFKFLRR